MAAPLRMRCVHLIAAILLSLRPASTSEIREFGLLALEIPSGKVHNVTKPELDSIE